MNVNLKQKWMSSTKIAHWGSFVMKTERQSIALQNSHMKKKWMRGRMHGYDENKDASG